MNKPAAFLLIVLLSPLIAGVYGILHDQLTYNISSEYFTRFKFYQFQLVDADGYITHSDRLLVSAVGFGATWWVGLIIGVVLALIGLTHASGKIMLRTSFIAVVITLSVAVIFGFIGLTYANVVLADKPRGYFTDWFFPENLADFKSFITVGSIHNFSYIGGVVGLICGASYSIWKKVKTDFRKK